ncbi:MAG: HDOD domain-containing protein [Candidatus Thiodiazotropha sp.]
MTRTVQDWVSQLSTQTLPVMRRTLTHVRDLLNQSSVNHTRLSEVIARDPGFSLTIIQKLTSLPNPPREAISRVSLAIPLLGMDVVDQASRTLPCLEDRLQGPTRRGLIDCYSRAVHAAHYAQSIAEWRRVPDSKDLYTAALLHDLGEMTLWCAEPDTMLSLHRRIQSGDDRESVARELLGTTFEELSAQLSHAWRLPASIEEAQGLSNSYQPTPLTVMLASALARESSLGWNLPKTLESLELLAEFLEIPVDRVTAMIHRLAAETARDVSILPMPLPAFHLLSLPVASVKPEESVDVVQPDLSTEERQKPAHSKTEPQAPPAAAQRGNPLQELINEALHRMEDDLGLSRAMFAMLTPDKAALKARLVIESEHQLSLKSFMLHIDKPSLFSILMKKPQAISLNRNNADKYLSMIPPSAREQINTSGFVAMSIFIKNKPVGLFYADNGLSGPGVTRHQFENFKVICQGITKSIG